MALDISDRQHFDLRRQDKNGVISLVCDQLDDFYIAVLSEDDIRPAIERGLKKVMQNRGFAQVRVETHGSLAGPIIKSIAHPA